MQSAVNRAANLVAICTLAGVVLSAPSVQADEFPEANDTIFRALIDEMNRSMTLQLEDLSKPYFIQYGVSDNQTRRMSASFGALVRDTSNRSRRLSTAVRVGSKELDNTNFGGGGRGFGRRGRGGGGGGALPIDDDYTALRQAIWAATDGQYKQAVETLTEKKAYMEELGEEDRPADFSEAPVAVQVEPKVAVNELDDSWRERVRRYSSLFAAHAHVTDSSVDLNSTASNRYLVNSDGTRLRLGKTTVQLRIRAQARAADGRTISDGASYLAKSLAGLPDDATIVADIAEVAKRLQATAQAPVLEEYVGPVLFDEVASCQVFQALLAQGLAGQPSQVGGGRRRFGGSENLERRIGRNILPSGFHVVDDPSQEKHGDDVLAGHYRYDDDGVAATKVDLVEDGRLVGLVMSRIPTQSKSGSTGHGRGGRAGSNRATIGCLYVTADEAVDDAALKQKLIEEAKDQGLDFALRIEGLSGRGGGGNLQAMIARMRRGGGGGRGGGSSLGDPTKIYKVYVADGREELVRGCEFGEVGLRNLRRIIGVGKEAAVYNLGAGGAPYSIVAPAVVFDELELASIEGDPEREPVLKAPHAREGEETNSVEDDPLEDEEL